MSSRPSPRVNEINRPFWEACNDGKLVLQRCLSSKCAQFVYYPRVCCPHCGGGDLQWTEVSGRGRILSYTAVHRPQHESFYPEAPIQFIAVSLNEGPLMYSRLLELSSDDGDVLDRAVQVVFVDHGNGDKVPFFKLVRD